MRLAKSSSMSSSEPRWSSLASSSLISWSSVDCTSLSTPSLSSSSWRVHGDGRLRFSVRCSWVLVIHTSVNLWFPVGRHIASRLTTVTGLLTTYLSSVSMHCAMMWRAVVYTYISAREDRELLCRDSVPLFGVGL
jgi:hypothetical protein